MPLALSGPVRETIYQTVASLWISYVVVHLQQSLSWSDIIVIFVQVKVIHFQKQHIICQTIIIFLCAFLFIIALPCCSSLQVSVPRKEYEVASGDDVTLTCSFVPANPDITIMVLTWEAVQENNNEDPLVRGLVLNLTTTYLFCVIRLYLVC